MKKRILQKSITIMTFYWLMVFALGCQKYSCDDAFFTTYKCYRLRTHNSIFYYNNNIINNVEKLHSDTGWVDRYGITLTFDLEKFAQENTYSLIAGAYASPCEDHFIEIEDKIRSIKIFSLLEFDELHAPGADVSEYFKYVNINKIENNSNKINIDDIVINEGFYKINEFDYGLITPLILTKNPSSPRLVQFKVVVEFESETILESITPLITIMPN